ncbi:porin family protein [bacterium]|nr:porin family protein [bacterium]
MKNLQRVALVLFVIPSMAHAIFKFDLEPIVGYERVQKFLPTAHTKDRLVLGGRVVLGTPLISAEAEYTRANDTESYPATSTDIAEQQDKARVGLRSTYNFALVSVFARAGAQARLTKRTVTVSGTPSTQTDPITYNPYAGAGARVHIRNNIALSADITVVFNGFPNMNMNDYMTTAGLVVSFP